jgi:hypothetical protein
MCCDEDDVNRRVTRVGLLPATVTQLKFCEVRALSILLHDSEGWVLHENRIRRDEILKIRGGFQ